MNQLNKVMIVDDSLVNLELLVAVLEDDFILETATTGKKACQLIDIFQPDVVLLDIELPDISGYEICNHYKSKPLEFPCKIILISGYDSPDEIKKGFDLGADDYLTKPIDHKNLINKINKYSKLYEK
jgi:CheY-like chemotaxis protein